jgi:hypothetical protein
MEQKEDEKKTPIQVWDEWDDAQAGTASAEGPQLCRIDNPDCEACQ